MKCKTCYTTLAMGYEYRQHTKKLAKDIESLSPGIPLVVLTDNPKDFSQFQSAIAIKHVVESLGLYHDKLICFEKCFKEFDCVIFLDADCRLLNNFALSREWKPGITALTCWDLKKHLSLGSENLAHNQDKFLKKRLKRDLAYAAASDLDINIGECKFIYEAVIILKSDNGKEMMLIDLWKKLRDHFEGNGIYAGEGVSIGLAANKSGLKIYHYLSGYPDERRDLEHRGIYKDKLFYKLLIHNDKDGLSEETCKKIIELEREREDISNLPLPRKIARKIPKLASKIRQRLILQDLIFVGRDD